MLECNWLSTRGDNSGKSAGTNNGGGSGEETATFDRGAGEVGCSFCWQVPDY